MPWLSSNAIAKLVFDKFNNLPKKGKPEVRPNGIKEWTVLAGIVLEVPGCLAQCVSLATGVKAMPNESLSKSNGTVIHDMHAEILAIRGFNRFVLEECLKIVKENCQSDYVIVTSDKRSKRKDYIFGARPGLKISLYVSEAPCGDASMSLVSNGVEDGWSDPLTFIKKDETKTEGDIDFVSDGGDFGTIRGRDHFLHVGLTRTKPGRRDSPITYSKSCSDKLCLSQVSSLLLGPVSSIVSPEGFYLSALIVPEAAFREDDFIRAFDGRLTSRSRKRIWDEISPNDKVEEDEQQKDIDLFSRVHDYGYKLKLFKYSTTSEEWEYKRDREEDAPSSDNNTNNTIDINRQKPCATSVLYIEGQSSEAISNGVKMGARPFLGKGQSIVCRKQISQVVWQLHEIAKNNDNGITTDNTLTYISWKKRNKVRYEVKEKVYQLLKGWVNTMEDDFSLIQ